MDLIKIVISFIIFLKASVYDLREREVPDELWMFMVLSGVILDVVQYLIEPYNIIFALIQFLIIFVLANFMFYIAGFGGADAKALMALSVMFPIYPKVWIFPILNRGLGVFAFSVLSNSVVVAPLIAIIFFLRNLKEEGRFIYRFIGYKVRADEIPKFHNLLEYIDENGGLVRTLRGVEPDEDMLRRLKEAKKRGKIDKIWVTPALPFLVFMTAGFVVSVVFGDVIVWLITGLI